ncbi:hypothetical protein [Nostoc sp.]|uniref:hypothetical protein n=1 Tax=Nostoc sp. TaxID=1180 RepID=UPI002FF60A4B
MTITISEKAFDELFEETVEPCQYPDPDDVLDVVCKLPQWQGQGYWRNIQLRQGLVLTIGNFQMCDRTIVTFTEHESNWLDYHFHFSALHN